jgi:ActR/RegA family two-component response regulator
MRSVMIIDDDLGFAESLADMLRKRGYAACCLDTPSGRSRRCANRATAVPLPRSR